ncbi:hypothetical protein GCM10010300_79890 [Streptomyces olivaceoviridis]|nr:hypothetical protein GCM10010300_79890 [Streptomyces olivaceoviridis]
MAGLPPPEGVSGAKARQIVYEPVGLAPRLAVAPGFALVPGYALAPGPVGGTTAAAPFEQARMTLGSDEDAPDATGESRS